METFSKFPSSSLKNTIQHNQNMYHRDLNWFYNFRELYFLFSVIQKIREFYSVEYRSKTSWGSLISCSKVRFITRECDSNDMMQTLISQAHFWFSWSTISREICAMKSKNFPNTVLLPAKQVHLKVLDFRTEARAALIGTLCAPLLTSIQVVDCPLCMSVYSF